MLRVGFQCFINNLIMPLAPRNKNIHNHFIALINFSISDAKLNGF